VVKDDKATGKRVVAGTHWDFDSYGGTIKKQLGMPTQASHPDSVISNFSCKSALQTCVSSNKLGIPVLTCTCSGMFSTAADATTQQAACACA